MESVLHNNILLLVQRKMYNGSVEKHWWQQCLVRLSRVTQC